MKFVFYTYWIWYALMLFIEVLGVTMPIDYAKAFLALYYLNFAYPALAVYGLFYTEDLNRSKVYACGITISVLLRTLFFIAEIYGYNDKKFVLVLCFFVMAVYMICEKLINRKLKNIESDYFKY